MSERGWYNGGGWNGSAKPPLATWYNTRKVLRTYGYYEPDCALAPKRESRLRPTQATIWYPWYYYTVQNIQLLPQESPGGLAAFSGAIRWSPLSIVATAGLLCMYLSGPAFHLGLGEDGSVRMDRFAWVTPRRGNCVVSCPCRAARGRKFERPWQREGRDHGMPGTHVMCVVEFFVKSGRYEINRLKGTQIPRWNLRGFRDGKRGENR